MRHLEHCASCVDSLCDMDDDVGELVEQVKDSNCRACVQIYITKKENEHLTAQVKKLKEALEGK